MTFADESPMPSRSVSVPACTRRHLVGRQAAHHVERPDERLGLEPGVVGAVEVVDDSFQRFDRGHPADVYGGCVLPATEGAQQADAAHQEGGGERGDPSVAARARGRQRGVRCRCRGGRGDRVRRAGHGRDVGRRGGGRRGRHRHDGQRGRRSPSWVMSSSPVSRSSSWQVAPRSWPATWSGGGMVGARGGGSARARSPPGAPWCARDRDQRLSAQRVRRDAGLPRYTCTGPGASGWRPRRQRLAGAAPPPWLGHPYPSWHDRETSSPLTRTVISTGRARAVRRRGAWP